MTWGIDYANSYRIEISEDGKSWIDLIKVCNGLGDEEIIKISPYIKTRYIRFSDFGFPQRTPAILGDIRVYGTEREKK